jgi:hypothetical protein
VQSKSVAAAAKKVEVNPFAGSAAVCRKDTLIQAAMSAKGAVPGLMSQKWLICLNRQTRN